MLYCFEIGLVFYNTVRCKPLCESSKSERQHTNNRCALSSKNEADMCFFQESCFICIQMNIDLIQ